MSGSAWRHLAPAIAWTIAIGLALLTIYAVWSEKVRLVENDIREHYYSDKARSDSYANVENACSNLQGPSLVDCIIKQTKPARDEERGEKDLSAQESMSRWALYLLGVSFLGLFVSGIGIWLINATLNVTREIVGVENRPWLKLVVGIEEPIVSSGQDKWSVTYVCTMRNFGSCPAVWARVNIRDMSMMEISKLSETITEMCREEESSIRLDNFGGTVFPNDDLLSLIGKTINLETEFAGRPEARPFSARLVVCVATYMSSYDKSVHHTWYAVRMTAADGRALRFDPARRQIPLHDISWSRLPMDHGAT